MKILLAIGYLVLIGGFLSASLLPNDSYEYCYPKDYHGESLPKPIACSVYIGDFEVYPLHMAGAIMALIISLVTFKKYKISSLLLLVLALLNIVFWYLANTILFVGF